MYKYNKYHLLYYYYSLCIFLTSKVKFKTPIENLDLDTGATPSCDSCDIAAVRRATSK